MTAIRYGWIIVVGGLCAASALAQTAQEGTAVPPLDLPPVITTPAAPPAAVLPPPPGPSTAIALPPGIEGLPMASEPGRSARIAALRETFETLSNRDALNTALRQPVSPETLARIEDVAGWISAAEAGSQMEDWRTQTLEFFAQALGGQAVADLPAGIPAGTRPEIALAVLEAQATLYSQPAAEADKVIRVLDARSTMLRVAETGAFTLVWSVDDGFVFVLSPFREVF